METWIDSERHSPGYDDTNKDMCVFVLLPNGEAAVEHYGLVSQHPEKFPYWLPIPHLPEGFHVEN